MAREIRVEGENYVYDDGEVVYAWEISKADKVEGDRKIDLIEVASVFADEKALALPDRKYPDRGKILGVSSKSKLLMVVHLKIVDDTRVQVVTAFEADAKQRRLYRESQRSKGGMNARGRGRGRDKDRGTPTFLEFFRRHHRSQRPLMARLPRKGKRSSLPGALGRIQERTWALAHAKKALTVGGRLAAIRKVAGITQAALAERSAVAQASISRIERDVESLGFRRAEKLARALRVSPMELLWGRK